MAEDVVVAEDSKKKKNPVMIILIFLLVIVLLVAGFVGYAYFTKSFFFAPKDAEAAIEEVELDETMFALDGFVVNLKTENSSKRYLKITIALGCINKKDIKRLEEKQYQIRDIVITTLRSKNIDLLSSEDGEDQVKEELATNINSLFQPDIEMNVYYTEYIIQ